MEEEVIGIDNRLKFYIACFWTNELNFYYYSVRDTSRIPWIRKRRREIMAKARHMGAFQK